MIEGTRKAGAVARLMEGRLGRAMRIAAAVVPMVVLGGCAKTKPTAPEKAFLLYPSELDIILGGMRAGAKVEKGKYIEGKNRVLKFCDFNKIGNEEIASKEAFAEKAALYIIKYRLDTTLLAMSDAQKMPPDEFIKGLVLKALDGDVKTIDLLYPPKPMEKDGKELFETYCASKNDYEITRPVMMAFNLDAPVQPAANETATAKATATATAEVKPEPTPTATAKATVQPTAAPTVAPTVVPTVVPTVTPTAKKPGRSSGSNL